VLYVGPNVCLLCSSKCLIVFDVFQSDNDGFGGQSVSNCISP
jgi:hypothetical protein